jgi:hypothetical protein
VGDAVVSVLDHIAATAPADHLVVVAVRYLTPGGRTLGHFDWITPDQITTAPAWWDRNRMTGQVVEDWRWVHGPAGGPEAAVKHGHVHVWHPGVPMLRLVTATRRPESAGKLQELATALGVMVDLDVAERRPGDRRRYCPSILAGLEFLAPYKPSVIIDAGGGLAAVWLFDRPVHPVLTRDLATDVITDVGLAAERRGWEFDSPAFGGQWLKAPGCHDHFRRHDVAELCGGPVWGFEHLRAIVPRHRRTAWRWTYTERRAVGG